MSVRPAAVAGTFYEADADNLRAGVLALLDAAPPPRGPRPEALVVPHAGYIYSGATAARAFRRLQPWAADIRRVVLLGPAHRVPLRGMAVAAADAFATPLGQVPVDGDWRARALSMEGIGQSGEAHRLEHSLEVQLPFLQSVLGDFSLLPLLVGLCPREVVARAVDALWGGPETLVVVSTDLSHFHGYADARERDARTIARIIAGDTGLSGHDACGAHALNGLLRSARAAALEVELIDACNSGDTAGDRQRVVGYGAFELH